MCINTLLCVLLLWFRLLIYKYTKNPLLSLAGTLSRSEKAPLTSPVLKVLVLGQGGLCLQPGLSSVTHEGREMKWRKVKCAQKRDCQLRIMALKHVRECQAQGQCHSTKGVCGDSTVTLPLAPWSAPDCEMWLFWEWRHLSQTLLQDWIP